ncbi:MAG: PrgI family mobile element protein, partial [Patescibacteria group bacterium]
MYQIPQFLDSGDKVFFSLGFIQLLFLLVGFFLALGIYYLISSFVPGIGAYALIPAAPVFLVFGYLAAGKFNGRYTYLYLGKFIKLFTTSQKLTYQHVADLSDLHDRFGSLDIQSKLKE